MIVLEDMYIEKFLTESMHCTRSSALQNELECSCVVCGFSVKQQNYEFTTFQ